MFIFKALFRWQVLPGILTKTGKYLQNEVIPK